MNKLIKTGIFTFVAALMSVEFSSREMVNANGQDAQQQSQAAAQQQVEEEFDVPVGIEAPVEPMPVRGDDGKWYFVYHLFLWNWSSSDLILKSVEVLDGNRGTILAHYDEQALSRLYRFRALLPSPDKLRAAERRRIPSGRTAALFVGLTVATADVIPTTLKHRFIFEANPLIRLLREALPDPGGNMVLDNFMIEVSNEKPVVIGPPLRGGPWKCSGGIDNNSLHQHQTSLSVQDGQVRIPERFAIDFQKIDTQGDILPNPFPVNITNKMFYGYGEEVLAVADGIVTFVKDGIPENVPQSSGEVKPAVAITRETVAGNQVGIELGKSNYAFYAHLQPGSIRVKTGDKVRRGEVIGLVGNAGNSVGPHLHFHVCDKNSLNGSEGLPFAFDSFDAVGHWPENYKPAFAKTETRRHRMQMPLKDTVVSFPGR